MMVSVMVHVVDLRSRIIVRLRTARGACLIRPSEVVGCLECTLLFGTLWQAAERRCFMHCGALALVCGCIMFDRPPTVKGFTLSWLRSMITSPCKWYGTPMLCNMMCTAAYGKALWCSFPLGHTIACLCHILWYWCTQLWCQILAHTPYSAAVRLHLLY